MKKRVAQKGLWRRDCGTLQSLPSAINRSPNNLSGPSIFDTPQSKKLILFPSTSTLIQFSGNPWFLELVFFFFLLYYVVEIYPFKYAI